MTKVDIFSGFLGAGKTTLIKKLISEAYAGEKLVLIENEFGEIGIDGGFLKDAGVEITEMNSGCICCSLVGDFGEALKKVLRQFSPDRIIIEPSGVGKLSDVIRAVERAEEPELALNGFTTVVDAGKCKMYMKNFGEFFNNQIENAAAIVLSRTGNLPEDKVTKCANLLRLINPRAEIITTPWDQLSGKQIQSAIEGKDTLALELAKLEEEAEECSCGCCGHDHDHEHHDHEHHDHDHEHHHHDHHADEVFTSWGTETAKAFTEEELRAALDALADEARFGMVLRAKGIVAAAEGRWLHFDYVPGEADLRRGCADTTGRLCVIGSGIREDALKELFGV